MVPGLTVTTTQSEALTTARIRGIGTVGDNAGLESSVGIVIDGVYRPRNGVGFGDLGELERIEVLKGPQGTVFGKNTSAGVINVVTKRPSCAQRRRRRAHRGNYGAVRRQPASCNTSVGENAAFRIYATKRSRDGFIDVETGARPRTSDEDVTTRITTRCARSCCSSPRRRVDINFTADFTKRNEELLRGVTTVRGPTAAIVDATGADCGRGGGSPTRSTEAGVEQPRQRAGHQGLGPLGRGQLGPRRGSAGRR